MLSIILFELILFLSVFLCSLTTGFLFAFAVVVMPGIKKLNNAEYIRAFQVIDGVIQNNSPMFIIVWLGSVITLLATCVMAMGQLEGAPLINLFLAAIVYVFGVQLPTITINIPLNNKLQALDTTTSETSKLNSARLDFESRWTRWNTIRTVNACAVTAALIVLSLLY